LPQLLLEHLRLNEHRSSYFRYAHLIFGNGVTCQALLDSGNEWGSAISEDLAERLGFQMTSLAQSEEKAVGTAKAGAQLQILGEFPRPISFSFVDKPALGEFKIQPALSAWNRARSTTPSDRSALQPQSPISSASMPSSAPFASWA